MIEVLLIVVFPVIVGASIGAYLYHRNLKLTIKYLRESRLLWMNEARRLNGQDPHSGKGLIPPGPWPDTPTLKTTQREDYIEIQTAVGREAVDEVLKGGCTSCGALSSIRCAPECPKPKPWPLIERSGDTR